MEISLKLNTLQPVTPIARGEGQVESSAKVANGGSTTVTDNAQAKELFTKDELVEITEQLSKFMQTLNADIQFAVHEKTGQLMVQVVDNQKRQVLKEFPSHELLDTIARIRDYVGVLLDKKV